MLSSRVVTPPARTQRIKRTKRTLRLSPIPENGVAISRKSKVRQILHNGSRELDLPAPTGLRVVDHVPGHSPSEEVLIQAPKTGDELTLFFTTVLEKQLREADARVAALYERVDRIEKELAQFRNKHVFVLNEHLRSYGGTR